MPKNWRWRPYLTFNHPHLASQSCDLIDAFIEMITSERAASKHTIDAYRSDLIQLGLGLQELGTSMLKAQKKDITTYFQSSQMTSLGSSSLARRRSSMRQFYQFLCTDGLRQDNPSLAIDAPQSTHSLPNMLSQADITKLIESAAHDHSIKGIRMLTLLEILYATGMRVSELVSLRASQIAFNHDGSIRPFITIMGKGKKERICPLNQASIVCLHHYLKIRDKTSLWLFPSYGSKGHLTRQRFGQLLKALAHDANVSPDSVSPHIIRHSFASHMLHHGADLKSLQQLLGHSDITTTQIYTHLLDEQTRQLVLAHHPLSQVEAITNSE